MDTKNKQLHTLPDALNLWQGIGGHFDSLTQILAEFIDNSISNFACHRGALHQVRVSFSPENGGYWVTVEDTGTGIENLEPVLRLGDKSVGETYLNEHGFGLKHALASANYENNQWSISTRTSLDFQQNSFRRVVAPYTFSMTEEKVQGPDWPGVFNNSGTVVRFKITDALLDSVRKGAKGKTTKLTNILDYLVEDLGYLYSGVIKKGEAAIDVIAEGEKFNQSVPAVEPKWVGTYDPGEGKTDYDLGNGTVRIEYYFGEIEDSNHRRYYKKNQATQGAEIRINGRLILANQFTEIWGLERHNTYNHFLVTINLVTEHASRLPQTRTSKNGVRSGDERLKKLFEWIQKTHPTPDSKPSSAQSERELVEILAKCKETHIRASEKKIIQEHEVFKKWGSPVSADLYVYDGSDVVIYEAKKESASIKEVYQLVMYWDGLVSDGIDPAEGILVAVSFPEAVKKVLEYFNGRQDANGNPYILSARTWREEGVLYP